MSWTKRQFVVQAREEIGLASYLFDAQPEQLQSIARRMDAMMATWNGVGIRVGYPIAGNPKNVDLDTETNVPDVANQAIYLNLAVQIGPSRGKVVSRELKVAAKGAYDGLLSKAAQPGIKQFPTTTPVGAGNKPGYSRRRFMPKPVDPLQAGTDSIIEFD